MNDYTLEIIIFVVVLLVVAGKPYNAMEATNSILGKSILLVAVIALALKSKVAGLLGALLVIMLSEGVREGMTSKDDKNKEDKDKDDKKDMVKKDMVKKDDEDDKDDNDDKDKGVKKDDSENNDDKKNDSKKTKDTMKSGTDRLNITETIEKLQKLSSFVNKA